MKQLIAAASLLIAAVPASATTVVVGNPAVPAPITDTCNTCTFVVNDPFNLAGLSITNYKFYANNPNTITPFLASRVDNGPNSTFTVTGIGQQQTASVGVNTFSFSTAAGSNVTLANSYFGFAYNTGGVVAFDYTSATGGTFVGPANYFPSLNGTFVVADTNQATNAYDNLNDRAYSINATGAVPEPATWAMMLMGFGMVGFGLRSRRKQSLRVTYA